MKKLLKWTGIILLVLILTAALSAFLLMRRADNMMQATYNIDPPMFEIPNDTASINRGMQLASLCTECHGTSFEGLDFFNDSNLGVIWGPNLTRGKGGVVAAYTDKDWIRALRHGVNPQGRGLVIMPSHDYNKMSREDIASVIAYMKQVFPIEHPTGQNKLTPLGKLILAVGGFGEVFAVKKINHAQGPGGAPARNVGAEYGGYLVDISGCRTCHQEQLHGGKHPDPNSPPVPNLTPAGKLSNWPLSAFVNTMRSGITPEGKQLNAKYMPYPAFAYMSDGDLEAIYMYLKSLKPSEPAK